MAGMSSLHCTATGAMRTLLDFTSLAQPCQPQPCVPKFCWPHPINPLLLASPNQPTSAHPTQSIHFCYPHPIKDLCSVHLMQPAQQSHSCQAPVHPTHPKVLGRNMLQLVSTLQRHSNQRASKLPCWFRQRALLAYIALPCSAYPC